MFMHRPRLARTPAIAADRIGELVKHDLVLQLLFLDR
jgi:hypothetical protein